MRDSRRARRRRAAVLGVLTEHGPLPATEISKRIGWRAAVLPVLEDLETAGLVTTGLADDNGRPRRYWRVAEPKEPTL